MKSLDEKVKAVTSLVAMYGCEKTHFNVHQI